MSTNTTMTYKCINTKKYVYDGDSKILDVCDDQMKYYDSVVEYIFELFDEDYIYVSVRCVHINFVNKKELGYYCKKNIMKINFM